MTHFYLKFEDTRPDERGRRLFFLRWLSFPRTDDDRVAHLSEYDRRKRGQIFREVPEEQIEALRERGHTVEIVEHENWPADDA